MKQQTNVHGGKEILGAFWFYPFLLDGVCRGRGTEVDVDRSENERPGIDSLL